MSIKKIGIVSGVLFALVVAVTPVIAACDLSHPEECTNEQLTALIQGLSGTGTGTGTTGSISGIPAGFQFNTNLKQTSTGNDVKYLQILLNSDAATKVATTGAGSPGNETTYFGPATKAAVIKFQQKYASEVLAPYGLTAGTGYFGVSSRTKANAILAGGGPVTTCPTEAVACVTGGYNWVNGACSCQSTCPTTAVPCVTAGYNWVNGVCSCSGTTPPVVGGFSVALATTNPAAGTLIADQSAANLLEVLLTNGTSSEVKVTAIELTRLGVSSDSTLSNIYLFEGATRLTDASVLSSKKVTFSNSNGVIVIPANSSKTISVKSDILTGTAGQTVGISVSGVTASTTLGSTLPVNGNIHTIAAAANLATLAFSGVLPGNTTTDPMDGVRVWEATAQIGNRSVEFTKLMLKQINSIDSKDIKNFRLLVDGTQVASVDSIDANGYVTFAFTKTLATGNRNLKVLADITGGSGRIAQFSLRNKADVEMKDSEYGVAISASSGVPATTGTITINPGSLTITKATDSPSGKVPNNTSGATLAKYTIKAYGEAIKVETLTVGFTYTDAGGGANAGATLRNGQVYINGSSVDSNRTLLAAGTSFNTNFIVGAGETATVEIKADIYDNDGAGAGIENSDTIKVKLVTGSANGWKQVSYGTLNVPSADTDASTMIVGEGAATLVKTASYANQNVVVPQTLYKIGSYQLIASSTEDINISSFSLDVDEVTNATLNEDDLRDIYIVYGGVTSSIKATATSDGQDNDWAVSYTLAKNATITIDVYARILGGATPDDSFKTDLSIAGTGALSGAAVTQSNVVGQTVIAKTGSFIVTRDASTPIAAIIDDSGTVRTYSLKFDAQNDSYVLSEVYVAITETTAVSSVELKDGSSVVGTAVPGTGGLVSFTGMAIPVSANTQKVLDVNVVMAAVGYGAGTSEDNIATDFTEAVVRANSTGEVGNVATAMVTDNTVAGNAIYVYKAIPTVGFPSSSSVGSISGQKTIAKFTVSPGSTGTIAWKKIVVNVTKTSNAGPIGPQFTDASLELYDVTAGGAGVKITGVGSTPTVDDCDSAAATSCVVTFAVGTDADDNVEEQVSSPKTYELRATVTGTITSGDRITTQIVANTGHAVNAAYTAVANAEFVWSDMSAQNHNTGTTDWINDNLLNIPTSTQEIKED